MMNKITYARLRQCISYDPSTGRMYWLVTNSNCAPAGSEVRGKTVRGYRRVQIDGYRYKAHDIAWFYMRRQWPKNLIDHRDCNPDNLRWENLREATQMQNCANRSIGRNNTSGVKGISWHKKQQKWVARVGVGKIRVQIGSFADLADAERAIVSYRAAVHGEFANNG